MLLGVIADDFTGASDIAVTLAKGLPEEGGLRTSQFLGLPKMAADQDIEAGVIALKSRSLPVKEAVDQSLQACRWLLAQGCQQIVFKYCSTFDSTPQGNIGPVLEALADALDAYAVVACPAFPDMGRTVYQGHLFVWDKLLNESGMEHHPLTPMKDPDLRRVLKEQSSEPVSHISLSHVRCGADALTHELAQLAEQRIRAVVVDAITNTDLETIGLACASARLVTGASGIARGLPHNFIARGLAKGGKVPMGGIQGREAILVGSCSSTTRKQIAQHAKAHPVLELSVDQVMAGQVDAADLVAFVRDHDGEAPLIYSSGDPEWVEQAQRRYGRERVAATLDKLFGQTAKLLIEDGVRRLVVGGGETSGAVVSALNLGALTIGPEIDTGVPVLLSAGKDRIALALKSGNFGGADFFAKAAACLRGEG